MPRQTKAKEPEIDPILHLMPEDQLERVFNVAMCDIAPEFLGFTDIYQHLAAIIPLHWTIVDLGCAYAPQAWLFKDHKAYVGVTLTEIERFHAPNTTHYTMPIREFLQMHLPKFDQDTTFAICSYVPPWHDDNRKLAREAFKNVFTYYPAGGPMIHAYPVIAHRS
jgi:hypothetical protein